MIFAINKCRIMLQIAVTLASFQLISAQSIIWDTTCGTSKGCFPECNTGCKYLVTWYTSGSVTYFDLKAEESDSNKFLAIGFSKDRRMGDDSVVGCVVPGNNTVQMYYNDCTDSEELSTPTLGLLSPMVSYANGVITCSFIRDVTEADEKYFNLNNDYYLMLVVGDVKEEDGGSYKLKKHKKIPWMSDGKVDFNSNKTYGLYELNSPLVKVHGIMMTLVWLLLVIVGMITTRYNEEMLPNTTVFGKKVWFPVYILVMVTAVVCVIIGFTSIFVEIDGYSQILEGNVGVKAHPVLGIIVTILFFVNAIMGLHKPGEDNLSGWIFKLAQGAVWAMTHVLAITTVFIGFQLERAMLSNDVIYITITHFVIVFFTCVILEIHKWMQQPPLPKLPLILLLGLGVVALTFELVILGIIATS